MFVTLRRTLGGTYLAPPLNFFECATTISLMACGDNGPLEERVRFR